MSRGIKIAISVGLLAFLISRLDLARAGEIAIGMHLGLLLLAVIVVIADRLFAAYRWYILLPTRNRIGFGRLVRFMFVSGFLGFLVPGTVGVEAVRIYSLSRATDDLAMAFSSVLVERLFGVLSLLILVLVGLVVAPLGLPPAVGQLALAGLAGIVLVVAVLMLPRLRALTFALLPGNMLGLVRSKLQKLYERLDAYQSRPGVLAWSMLLAVLFQMQRVVQVAILAWGLGLDFQLLHFFALMPIILFVTLLPISIAGFGVRETSFVYLLGLAGIEAEAGFTLALLTFVTNHVSVVIGAWLYVRGKDR
ncbi:MAG: flippase-like domain-containing protein [Minwuiales bacterium]|nr:flippase-like domain-containing protein [Minwuiales bacterium]